MMKKFSLLYVLCFALMLTVISCKKPNEPTIDLTKREILVKHPWKVDEVMSNVGGKNARYIAGGTNTTGVDYSKFKLVFNINGTGTYTAQNGVTFNTAWEFTSADEHNMKLTVYESTPVVFIWNMVEISEKSFQSTTAIDKLSILQSTRYVPIK